MKSSDEVSVSGSEIPRFIALPLQVRHIRNNI